MGLSNLSRFCLAVFSFSALVPALAADTPVPRGNVSVTVNPTTGYYSSTNSTVRLPSGVSVSPTTGLPVVSKYSGGLQQSIPTGITIDAIKKSAPLPTVVRATTQSVKNAATGCLKSGRCNVALMLAGQGLQQLFNSLDWVMGDGGKISKKSNDASSPEFELLQKPDGAKQTSRGCTQWENVKAGAVIVGWCGSKNPYPSVCYPSSPEYSSFAGQGNGWCYWLGSSHTSPLDKAMPVSPQDIDLGVDSNYIPEPSDWPALTSELELSDIEITSAPTLQGEPKTTTVYDADGNPHEVTETNIWYDFDIRDNKSSQPALDMKTRQETKTYKNGSLTGTTTTESTATGGESTAIGGGGGGAAPTIDIPTDCDFMPTVCAFLDWVKNDDTPEDPDLSALIDDRDFTESYSITGGSKQCPPPYEFTVDFIGRTYGLSFEPACDFASKMYFFVMAAAYIFAAYITVGAARNG